MSRVLLYSHDTYGLGHLRRSVLIAEALASTSGDHEILIVTGSPRAQSFALVPGIDTVKLPAVTKDDGGSYRPRTLGADLGRLIGVRSGIVRSVVERFEPDAIVVDHAPLGMGGELVPLLDDLRRARHRPRVLLGLRDIIDDAPTLAAAWSAQGVWSRLADYDRIVVYGDPRVLTNAQELDLSARVGVPVDHVGYAAPIMPPAAVGEEPFLLVTPGGGGDGHTMLRLVLDAIDAGSTEGVRVVVVSGPLLSPRRQAEVAARVRRHGESVTMLEFTDRMRHLISSCRGVISMAGYNTVVEELAADRPALLVPRSSPRTEQLLRAQRIAPHSRLEHCPAERLTPGRVRSFVERCLAPVADHTAVRSPRLDLSGAVTLARLLTLVPAGAVPVPIPVPVSGSEARRV